MATRNVRMARLTRWRILLTILLLTVCTLTAPSLAQERYPSKPITMIVGFAPGGSTDFIARLLAQKLEQALGQPVVVNNRGGANGLLAANVAAAAAPDGYTLLLTSMGLTTNPHVYNSIGYDPLGLTCIAMVASVPNLIVTNPSLPAKNLEELLALARSQRAPLTSATTGNAAPGHLASVLLERAANVRFEFVAYKGSGPAMVDLISGRVDMSLPTLLAALPFVEAGKLRAIAITGSKRSSLLPNVPTIAEAGVKSLSTGSGWYGLVGPAGMPKDIVERISTEVEKILKTQEVAERFVSNGADPMFMNPADMTAFVAQDYKQWGEVIREAKIKGDDTP